MEHAARRRPLRAHLPNARYYFVHTEVHRWTPDTPGHRAVDYNANVFEDSVSPFWKRDAPASFQQTTGSLPA